eukprot:2896534-Alexandrium_andersonii.AAC.1
MPAEGLHVAGHDIGITRLGSPRTLRTAVRPHSVLVRAPRGRTLSIGIARDGHLTHLGPRPPPLGEG